MGQLAMMSTRYVDMCFMFLSSEEGLSPLRGLPSASLLLVWDEQTLICVPSAIG